VIRKAIKRNADPEDGSENEEGNFFDKDEGSFK
jgi:hypothetical protein